MSNDIFEITPTLEIKKGRAEQPQPGQDITADDKPTRLRKALLNPTAILREINNRSFYHFLRYFWDEYSSEELVLNWHIKLMCDELQQIAERVAEGKAKKDDLLINIPPGTTKTATCMIMFPVWCWTRWYWMRIITLSYSADLSLESAEFSRDIIRSDKFKRMYPELEIKPDKDTKHNYRIVKKVHHFKGRAPRLYPGGNRFSTSVGGSLTGFHGHMILVDDPINPEQAVSETELKNTNRWLDQTLPTRKVDKAVAPTIMIMQRLHRDDPSGHLLSKKKKKLKHICLPGESVNYGELINPPELASNYVDGLLDPNRLSWEVLEEMENDLGQYGFAGQVGQKPTPPGGGMFKTDHLIVINSMIGSSFIVDTVRYWDKAGTKEKLGLKKNTKVPYTAGVKMHRLSNGKWLISDVKRGRWDSDEREDIIRAVAEADGKHVKVYHEQEPGSGGKQSAEYTTINLAGFASQADIPKGDKVYRADPFSVQVNRGNVFLLRADWNKEFIDELTDFPHGSFKDQVDAASGGFSKLVGKKQVKGH